MSIAPLLLIILDGWGLSGEKKYNAVHLGKTPVWDSLWQKVPSTQLQACGEAVGLPDKTMGNSEVGHMNIGAGRVVYQDLTRIHKAVREGQFFENPVLLEAADKVKRGSGRWHLMGLLSDGGVHSHIDHLFALLDFASQQAFPKVFVHCFTDGRDRPPQSGKIYLEKLQKKIGGQKNAEIATVIGRYFAMDRDKRWERTSKALNALLKGEGEHFSSAAEAIHAAYARDARGDEFVLPSVIGGKGAGGSVQDGDGICFFNFRADRARQLTMKLNEKEAPKLSSYITMTRYQKEFPYPRIFPPQNLENVFGKVVSDAGLRQLRIAETEKYAHVTYFFNGGKEEPFEGEERQLVPSPRDVATYDLKPEMSAWEVTGEILKALDAKKYQVMIINFANPDMVGHSGRLEAAIRAVETVDTCLGKIVKKLESLGGAALVTADHGNAECMRDENGKPHTAHTLNPVPLVWVGKQPRDLKLKGGGKLSDIAPTMLQLLGIEKPEEMSGASLIV